MKIFHGLFLVEQLLMGVQDVLFLPSRASYYTTFLIHCGRSEIFGIDSCLRIVVWCMQSHSV